MSSRPPNKLYTRLLDLSTKTCNFLKKLKRMKNSFKLHMKKLPDQNHPELTTWKENLENLCAEELDSRVTEVLQLATLVLAASKENIAIKKEMAGAKLEMDGEMKRLKNEAKLEMERLKNEAKLEIFNLNEEIEVLNKHIAGISPLQDSREVTPEHYLSIVQQAQQAEEYITKMQKEREVNFMKVMEEEEMIPPQTLIQAQKIPSAPSTATSSPMPWDSDNGNGLEFDSVSNGTGSKSIDDEFTEDDTSDNNGDDQTDEKTEK